MQDALAYSCNVALMDMALAIGPDDFTRYQHIFGFGEYTGIDLPGEAETSGLLYSADNMTDIDLATNSFGQNFNVNDDTACIRVLLSGKRRDTIMNPMW